MSTPTGPGEDEPSLAAVIGERHRLVNLAYRMLGSLAEAEDAVQETYARWYALPPHQRAEVASPGGWLTTVASRICLDLLRSARARRERYVGEWVPEPLPEPAEWPSIRTASGAADPAAQVVLDESVGMALLVVLDSMTPAERVAFILHDVFRYSFADVARIVGRTPAACRQLASSARHRIDTSNAAPAPAARQARIVRDLKHAWEAGNIAALIGLLDPAATLTTDGGGLVTAALHPIEGADSVARFLAGLGATVPGGFSLLERTVNGQPGLVAQQDGVTVTVFAFDIADQQIVRIWAIRNPNKLRAWLVG